MSKYKQGDKVICKRNLSDSTQGAGPNRGCLGIVRDDDGTGCMNVLVSWEGLTNGINRTPDLHFGKGSGWWTNSCDIEPMAMKEKPPTGTIVRLFEKVPCLSDKNPGPDVGSRGLVIDETGQDRGGSPNCCLVSFEGFDNEGINKENKNLPYGKKSAWWVGLHHIILDYEIRFFDLKKGMTVEMVQPYPSECSKGPDIGTRGIVYSYNSGSTTFVSFENFDNKGGNKENSHLANGCRSGWQVQSEHIRIIARPEPKVLEEQKVAEKKETRQQFLPGQRVQRIVVTKDQDALPQIYSEGIVVEARDDVGKCLVSWIDFDNHNVLDDEPEGLPYGKRSGWGCHYKTLKVIPDKPVFPATGTRVELRRNCPGGGPGPALGTKGVVVSADPSKDSFLVSWEGFDNNGCNLANSSFPFGRRSGWWVKPEYIFLDFNCEPLPDPETVAEKEKPTPSIPLRQRIVQRVLNAVNKGRRHA